MLELLIKAARPSIRDSSLKQYLSTLKSLHKKMGHEGPINNVDFLLDPQNVVDVISPLKSTTKKNTYNSIIVILSALKIDPVIVAKYTKLRDDVGQIYSDEMATKNKSASQERNWVGFEEYLQMADKLGAAVEALKGKKDWSVEEQTQFQEYLLVRLYTVYPLRNDFVMKIVSKQQFNKLTTNDKSEMNYLVVPSGYRSTLFFVLNEYKTHKKYGEQKLVVEDEVVLSALCTWIDRRPIASGDFPLRASALFLDGKDLSRPARRGTSRQPFRCPQMYCAIGWNVRPALWHSPGHAFTPSPMMLAMPLLRLNWCGGCSRHREKGMTRRSS